MKNSLFRIFTNLIKTSCRPLITLMTETDLNYTKISSAKVSLSPQQRPTSPHQPRRNIHWHGQERKATKTYHDARPTIDRIYFVRVLRVWIGEWRRKQRLEWTTTGRGGTTDTFEWNIRIRGTSAQCLSVSLHQRIKKPRHKSSLFRAANEWKRTHFCQRSFPFEHLLQIFGFFRR